MSTRNHPRNLRGFISVFSILTIILFYNVIAYTQIPDFMENRISGKKADYLSRKEPQRKLYDDIYHKMLRDSNGNFKSMNSGDAKNVELVGRWANGPCWAVAVAGNIAYFGNGGYLEIVDFSNPANPIELGKVLVPEAPVQGIAVSGAYAYVADGNDGLRVIDISDPINPFEAGYFDTHGYTRGVAVSGGYTYLADASNGLRGIDISNPANPFEAGYFDTGGSAYDVALKGDYAYVAEGYDGLRVIDISSPTNPFEAGYFDTGHYASGVDVSGDYAYVADASDGLRVIDVSNPTNPFEVGYFDTGSEAYGVAVNGDYAYVTEGYDGLRVINVSSPSNPFEAGYFDTGHFANDVAVNGGYAYVADVSDGLRVIDVSNPTNPFEVGYFDRGSDACGVAVSGDYAYVADWGDGLRVIDVSNPTNPFEAGYFDTFNAHGVAVSGDYAYVADGFYGLRVIDVSNPTNPFEAGYFDTGDAANGVAVSGAYAYVADGSDGLRVIDVSNPTNPFETGYFETGDRAVDVAVSGDYAYVADGDDGLRVIDISDPTNPFEAGYFDTGDVANGVAVSGDYAYVADRGYGLRVIDVSNPTNPFETGYFDTGGTAFDVAVIGEYAYVADGSDGLRVIDASNPTNPFEAGYFDTGDVALAVAVSGAYAYVADRFDGLYILRYIEELLPDLFIQSVDGPDEANKGENISVSVVLKNQGGSLTQGSAVLLKVVLSPDTIITVDDTLFADVWIDSSRLAAGDSTSETITANLPISLVGDYYIGAYIDANFSHDESNEDNNTNYDAEQMTIKDPYDLGFRPDPNGFKFPNHGTVSYRDWDMFKHFFGEDAVLNKFGLPRLAALKFWWNEYHTLTPGGSCVGMSGASLISYFWDSIDQSYVGEYSMPEYNRLFDHESTTQMEKSIAYYHGCQTSQQIRKIRNMKNPDQLFSQIEDSIRLKNHVILAFKDPVLHPNGGEHAVLPYKTQRSADGLNGKIWVYDCNEDWVGDNDKSFLFNFVNNSWFYEFDDGEFWHGYADTSQTWLYPIKHFTKQGIPLWDQKNKLELLYDFVKGKIRHGLAHLQFKTNEGFRLGYNKMGQFFDEIEGAFRLFDIGIQTEQTSEKYMLPSDQVYDVTVYGLDTGTMDFDVMADGYWLEIKEASITSTSVDKIKFDKDGRSLTYFTNDTSKTYSILFDLELEEMSREFVFNNTTLSSGDTSKFKIVNDLSIKYTNVGVSKSYDLALVQVAIDSQAFVYHNIPMEENEAHTLTPLNWNGLDTTCVFLDIDRGNNGTIDTTIILGNYPTKLYVNPITIDLGTHPAGYSFSSSFIVKNNGGEPLIGTISESASWITSLNPTSFNLTYGQQTTITFSGSFPSVLDTFSTNISIISNGGNQNVYVHGTIPITGFKGDVNDDGKRNILDIVLIVDFIVGNRTPTTKQQWAADCNDNGEINILDIVLLIEWINNPPLAKKHIVQSELTPVKLILEPAQNASEITKSMLVKLVTNQEVAGIQLKLSCQEDIPKLQAPDLIEIPDDMECSIYHNNNQLIILCYSLTGTSFKAGEYQLFELPVNVKENFEGTVSVKVDEIILSNKYGMEIPVQVQNEDLVFETVPKAFALDQNYPNPFNSSTRLNYQLPERSDVSISVFNLMGQEIKKLINIRQIAGNYEIVWDGTDEINNEVVSGVYLCVMQSGNYKQVIKMLLLR